MDSQEPQKARAKREDDILRKIFLVTLTDDTNSTDPTPDYLELTAALLLSEEQTLMLSSSIIERVLVDSLSGQFVGVDTPFSYLVGCYQRAIDALEKIKSIKDSLLRSELEVLVRQSKNLAVSYCRLHLISTTNPSEVSPLLPVVLGDAFSPRGFLDEFFGDSSASDMLEGVYVKLYDDISRSVVKVSALGNYQQPLAALVKLSKYPDGARALVNHPNWIPKGDHVNGSDMEMKSILGPFFHVSALPDYTSFKSQPDVGELCFSSLGSSSDVLSSDLAIKATVNNLYNSLYELLLSLLKNAYTRERVIEYFAEVIKKNSRRAQIQVDHVEKLAPQTPRLAPVFTPT